MAERQLASARLVRMLSAFALTVFAATAIRAMPATSITKPHYRVVGYAVANKPISASQAAHIDTLIFAFAKLVDGQVVLDADAARRLQTLTALKADHPQLKVVVSVGGWGVGGFSEAASSDAARQRFADSAAQMLLANHVDGLDVDWEYPGHDEAGITASSKDREHFTALLRTVRSTLDKFSSTHHAGHYSLSIAVADGPYVDSVDIAAIEPSLDWFNMMTYDFVNSMTATTGNHSGLHASSLAAAGARSTDKAVRQFLKAGVPSRKLLIGAAFYGREFAQVKSPHHGLYQAYGQYQGEHPWPELKSSFINKNGFVRHWDAAAKAPYLWNADTKHFISYDDPQSLAAKAAYVKSHDLGGIMYWEQSHDPQGELLDAIWHGLQ